VKNNNKLSKRCTMKRIKLNIKMHTSQEGTPLNKMQSLSKCWLNLLHTIVSECNINIRSSQWMLHNIHNTDLTFDIISEEEIEQGSADNFYFLFDKVVDFTKLPIHADEDNKAISAFLKFKDILNDEDNMQVIIPENGNTKTYQVNLPMLSEASKIYEQHQETATDRGYRYYGSIRGKISLWDIEKRHIIVRDIIDDTKVKCHYTGEHIYNKISELTKISDTLINIEGTISFNKQNNQIDSINIAIIDEVLEYKQYQGNEWVKLKGRMPGFTGSQSTKDYIMEIRNG
jgi:hypothetical protein